MPETRVQLPKELESLASEFSRRFRIARAADLARAGSFLEAEALLCNVGAAPTHSDELDMLARISVMRSRFSEARRRWSRALAKTNDKKALRNCIVLLDDYFERRINYLCAVWLAAFSLWVVLQVLLIVYLAVRAWL
jgi:hypothetical protein